MAITWKDYYEDGADRIRKMRNVSEEHLKHEEFRTEKQFEEARGRVLSMVEGFNFATRDLITDIAIHDNSISGDEYELLLDKLRIECMESRVAINQIKYSETGAQFHDMVKEHDEMKVSEDED